MPPFGGCSVEISMLLFVSEPSSKRFVLVVEFKMFLLFVFTFYLFFISHLFFFLLHSVEHFELSLVVLVYAYNPNSPKVVVFKLE